MSWQNLTRGQYIPDLWLRTLANFSYTFLCDFWWRPMCSRRYLRFLVHQEWQFSCPLWKLWSLASRDTWTWYTETWQRPAISPREFHFYVNHFLATIANCLDFIADIGQTVDGTQYFEMTVPWTCWGTCFFLNLPLGSFHLTIFIINIVLIVFI